MYLSRTISQTGGTYKDIKARITKPRQVIDILRPVLRMTAISTNTKLKIFKLKCEINTSLLVRDIRVISSTFSKIQIFINRYLQRLLQLRWFDKGKTKTCGQVQIKTNGCPD